MTTNPFLNISSLPEFSKMQTSLMLPAITQLIKSAEETLENCLKATKHYTWNNLILILEEKTDALDKAWACIRHMHHVTNNEALRPVYETCSAMISDFHVRLGQNEHLYAAIKVIQKEDTSLNKQQQKVVNDWIDDFEISGIHLPAAQKAEFRELNKQLVELTNQFEQNIMDASDAWDYYTEELGALSGLPNAFLLRSQENAREKNKTGYLLYLDDPTYQTVIQCADNEELRQLFYKAYVTRASDQANVKFDNTPIILSILNVRLKLANLLGFNTFADYALHDRIAKKTENVLTFLNDLLKTAHPRAKKEMEALQIFAASQNHPRLKVSDVSYYSEKLFDSLFGFTQESLRPFFPLTQVLSGLFEVIHRLFSVTIELVNHADVFHPDAQLYAVIDSHKNPCGYFYLDLFARPQKRDGGWMDECVIRRKTIEGKIQLPVTFLTMNFAPPSSEHPALLTHDEVTTLFHEFGHGLHHLLTKVDYADVSGIQGVPWDGVEFPSQWLENWCFEEEVLDLLSSHYETKEKLPLALKQKLSASRSFHSGLHLCRQIELGLFDFACHQQTDYAHFDVQTCMNAVREKTALLPIPSFNRFQNSFSHVFADSYCAGYYSYLWAEVLAADAYALFKEQGIFNKTIADRFQKTILECGGSEDFLELFIAFRGRAPSNEALLQRLFDK